MVITVGKKIEAKRLLANGFCFGQTIKKVEKYRKAGQGSVFMRCA